VRPIPKRAVECGACRDKVRSFCAFATAVYVTVETTFRGAGAFQVDSDAFEYVGHGRGVQWLESRFAGTLVHHQTLQFEEAFLRVTRITFDALNPFRDECIRKYNQCRSIHRADCGNVTCNLLGDLKTESSRGAARLSLRRR
jgi:hypothetical protein